MNKKTKERPRKSCSLGAKTSDEMRTHRDSFVVVRFVSMHFDWFLCFRSICWPPLHQCTNDYKLLSEMLVIILIYVYAFANE